MLELIFVEGDHRGEVIRLTFEKAWFGRQATCDFVLRGEGMSRAHFSIERHGEDYVLIDNSSTNGTFVNRVRTNALRLRDGYQIAAGTNVILVREVAASADLPFRFVAEWQAGDGASQVIEESRILLGRKSVCQIQLNDPAISRVHAEIERKPDGIWITDQSSAAGVYVNGQRIVEGLLNDGDILTIRPFEIAVRVNDEICTLSIRECADEAGAVADLPREYQEVSAPQPQLGSGAAKPSAQIASLPVWMQAKAPIWVPTSDILPNRFRAVMVLMCLIAVLGTGSYVWATHARSVYSPGPTAKVHMAAEPGFAALMEATNRSTECSACHPGFGAANNPTCASCHVDLHPSALHARAGVTCAGCHSEHRGADFDIARNVAGGCQSAGCHVAVHSKVKLALAKQTVTEPGVPTAAALEAYFNKPGEDKMHEKHANLKGECGSCHTSGDPTIKVARTDMRMRCLGCHGFGPEATLRDRCFSCHFEHPTTPDKVLSILQKPDTPVAVASSAANSSGGLWLALSAFAGVPLLYFAAMTMRSRMEHNSFRARTAANLRAAPAVPVAARTAESKSSTGPTGFVAPKPTDNQAPGGNLRPQIDLNLCVGCGTCVHVCPFNVLEIVNEKAIAVRLGDCTGYAACAAECPTDAIVLVSGGAMQTEELPVYDDSLETNVPGLYLAGEITGKALIKVAINQGKKVADSIVANRPDQGSHEYDVIVVGAGPAGVSTGLAARQQGLKVLVLEQGNTANTIRTYSRQKFVMAEPVMIPLYGPLWMEDGSKEALLERWEQIIGSSDIDIRESEKVLKVERSTNHFRVRSAKGEYTAARVVLAVGRRGSPRKLGVPGEDSTKVTYNLLDAEAYHGKAICIVGGGDSGIEAANGLARADLQNRVWLINRGEDFNKAKPRNQKKIQKSIAEDRVRVFYNAAVKEIRENSIVIKAGDETGEIENDFVFVMAGGESPKKFLSDCGIEFSNRPLG